MKQIKQNITFIIALFIIIGCSYSERNTENDTEDNFQSLDSSFNEFETLLKESENYLKNRDFDGDKISDYLSFSYSGGAHCCYKMILKLSSEKDTLKYPFEMDGGYEFGIVDGSQNDHFNIDDYDQDGLPEIFMGISTYNGEKDPIDPEWTTKYGIKTNFIIFDYYEGEIITIDYDKEKHKAKS